MRECVWEHDKANEINGIFTASRLGLAPPLVHDGSNPAEEDGLQHVLPPRVVAAKNSRPALPAVAIAPPNEA